MTVIGTGFTSGQTVAAVLNATQLQLSGTPNSTPSGIINFAVVGWSFDQTQIFVGSSSTGKNFGYSLALSVDETTLAISAANISAVGTVSVYKNSGNGFALAQIIPSTDTTIELALSNDGKYLAVADALYSVGSFRGRGNVIVYETGQTSEVSVGNLVPGYLYRIQSAGTTDFVLLGSVSNSVGQSFIATATGLVSSGKFVTGKSYIIATRGTTNFKLIGALSNNVGEEFIATGPGKGNGTAYQGSGVVSSEIYEPYQTLVPYQGEINGHFGRKVSFMNNSETLVVYSEFGDTSITTIFDGDTTTFDKKSTDFNVVQNNSGRVDIYDRYASKWVFSESLSKVNLVVTAGAFVVGNIYSILSVGTTDFTLIGSTSNSIGQTFTATGDGSGTGTAALVTEEVGAADGYGTGLAVGKDHIIVGAPQVVQQGLISGQVFDYQKKTNTKTWNLLHTEIDKPDVSKIKKAFLYNKNLGELITYIDIIDPAQGKIAGPAEEEIKYKAFYDPAVYSVGSDTVNVNSGTAWTSDQLGMLWWDLRTAKFLNVYENDPVHKNTNWNILAPGASIDVYEWVSYNQLPAVWDNLADTSEGIAKGISGTSLYGNSAYSVKQKYNNITKSFKNTYYFWVKNKKFIPNVPGRHMAAQDVANLIANPRGQGYKYLALTGTDSFSLVNVKPLLSSTDVVLSVEYWLTDKTDQNVHSHWKIVSNDPATYIPEAIEQKWIDSLCGKDSAGRVVPDPALPPKLRYGIENRPRQSMFVNRFEALKEFVENANMLLMDNQITESSDLTQLDSYDKEPTLLSSLYDITFDTDTELSYANVGNFARADISLKLADGKITDYTINFPGKGYLVAPTIEVVGTGENAKLTTVINTKGQITKINIVSGGVGYADDTMIMIRDYSALVHSDSKAGGNWSIYSYNPIQQSWNRVLTQAYDVRKFWNYTDWYSAGYSQFTSPDISVDTLADLNSTASTIGDIVKVRTVNSSGWRLLHKYSNSNSVDWTQSYSVIGIENGTIQLSSSLYQTKGTNLGFDNNIYDSAGFDLVAATELRIILSTLKNKIFINSLNGSYLNLFFNSVRYAHSEQPYIDWIFKTSFVKAEHNVGALDQPVTYQPDNLRNFEDYVNEVKPYRTKIREYVSNYEGTDLAQLPITDFDLQTVYENSKISTINTFVVDGKITSTDPAVQNYPWKFWLDNVGFEITDIHLISGGSNYVTEPQVIITSDSGTGATARAFITSGQVGRIVLLTPGIGYLSAPTITLKGGLAPDGVAATATARIGNSVIKSTRLGMKFDRIHQSYYITQLQKTETFTGSNNRVQFPLIWGPDTRIGQSSVTINGIPQLRDSYTLNIISSKTAGYTQYSGTITFVTAPAKNTTIVVVYNVDETLLNATDRIQYYYNPTTGMPGNELSQLMTGIDYGGVIVNGLGFDVARGWDSTPYYSDRWMISDDSFTDHIAIVGAGTHSFTLNYLPPANTQLNIYKYATPNPIRLDDPNFNIKSFITQFINAIAYDALLGSNFQSTQAGLAILNSITANGYHKPEVLLSLNNLTTVIKSVPEISSNATAITAINTYSSVVTGIVNGGLPPPLLFPTIPTTVTGQSSARTLLVDNIPFIQAEMLAYINANYPAIVFDHNLYSDQLAYIVNGLVYDLMYGGNSQTYYNALTYGNTIIPVAVYDRLNILAQGIITNTLLARLQTTFYQYTNASLTGGAYAGSSISTNISTFKTIVGTPTAVRPALVTPLISVGFTANQAIANGILNNTSIIIPKYNTGAIVNTFLADGATNTFTIPSNYTVTANTEFIIRQTTSDGSIKPQETDYDTSLSGGDVNTLNGVYATASGLLAEDIIVDGDNFVTTTSSGAPEEVIPGQVVDTVAIKIFDRPSNGSAVIRVDNYIGNGTDTAFAVSQRPNGPGAVIVKVNDSIKTTVPSPLTLGTVVITNAAGQFSCASTPLALGQSIVISGTIGGTGSIAGYVNPTTYYIIATNGTTTFTLSLAPAGLPITTTAGTPTGLTYTLLRPDYAIDYTSNQVKFTSAPAANSIISLFSIGYSGSNLLDIDYFIGDGTTTEFVTNTTWQESLTTIVYVDGVESAVVLFKTDDTYDISNAVGIRFGTPPANNKIINYVLVTGAQQTFAISKVETIVPNGSLTYTLQNTVGNALPNESNMIVRVNQTILSGPNNSYFVIGGNRLNYSIDAEKFVPYSVPVNNVVVIVGSTTLVRGSDYTVDLSGITVKINKTIYNAYKGQQLIVSIISGETYFYNSATGQITFTNSYNYNVNARTGDFIQVISSYQHDSLDIERTSINVSTSASLAVDSAKYYTYQSMTGGLIELDRAVIDDNYVWVIKNGTLLVPTFDYKLNDNHQSITMASSLNLADTVTLITFGSNILIPGIAYMQFKDMLNRISYKRLSLKKQTMLAQDLHWNDISIVVEDASNFDLPNPAGNKPGVVEIRGERIEYFSLVGNTLSRLRRATLGTGMFPLNKAGSIVQDIGSRETIPYTDTQTVKQMISDGTSIVALDFTPDSIHDMEIFVGGYNDGTVWSSGVTYLAGTIVNIGSYTYRCTTTHIGSTTFYSPVTTVTINQDGTTTTILENVSSSVVWKFFIGNIRLKKIGYSVFNINNAPYSPAGDVSFEPDFTIPSIKYSSASTWSAKTNVQKGQYLLYNKNYYQVTTGGTFTGNLTLNNTTVTNVGSVAGLTVGDAIVGAGIVDGTVISAIGVHTITLSIPANITIIQTTLNYSKFTGLVPPTHTTGTATNGTATLVYVVNANSIILNNLLTTGTQITVVKNTGEAWDSSVDILYDIGNIAEFLRAEPGVWYSGYKQISNTAITGISNAGTINATFDSAGTTFDSAGITFDQG